MLFPGHGRTLAGYAALWALAVCAQTALSHYNHHFGLRQLTNFVGFPVIYAAFPFWPHFLRRVVNPLLTLAAGALTDDRALAALLKSSAVGQAVTYALIYAVAGADEDARSDATIRR